MRGLFILGLMGSIFGWAVPAAAHDFWLQPRSFTPAAPGLVPTSIQIGHGKDRETWSKNAERILVLRSVGPDGMRDQRVAVRSGPQDTLVTLAAPGTHVLAMQGNHALSELPPVRFNDYLKLEGLTPAIAERTRTSGTDRPGREIYSRRAKALIQVGPLGRTVQPHVTTPLGLTLEIVPEANPYALRSGAKLPVRVFFEGRPLAGALVKLTDLAADSVPVETHLTDAGGRAGFRMPARGDWLLNVVWTKPIAGDPRGDFDTTFSSLTFGLPARR